MPVIRLADGSIWLHRGYYDNMNIHIRDCLIHTMVQRDRLERRLRRRANVDKSDTHRIMLAGSRHAPCVGLLSNKTNWEENLEMKARIRITIQGYGMQDLDLMLESVGEVNSSQRAISMELMDYKAPIFSYYKNEPLGLVARVIEFIRSRNGKLDVVEPVAGIVDTDTNTNGTNADSNNSMPFIR